MSDMSWEDIDRYVGESLLTPPAATKSPDARSTGDNNGDVVEIVSGNLKTLSDEAKKQGLTAINIAAKVTAENQEEYKAINDKLVMQQALFETAGGAAAANAATASAGLLAAEKAYDKYRTSLSADINDPESLRTRSAEAFVRMKSVELDKAKELSDIVNTKTNNPLSWLVKQVRAELTAGELSAAQMASGTAANTLQQQTQLLSSEGTNLRQNARTKTEESIANDALLASVAWKNQALDSGIKMHGNNIIAKNALATLGVERFRMLSSVLGIEFQEKQFEMQTQNANRLLAQYDKDQKLDAQIAQIFGIGLESLGFDLPKGLSVDAAAKIFAQIDPERRRFVLTKGLMTKATGLENLGSSPTESSRNAALVGTTFAGTTKGEILSWINSELAAVSKRVDITRLPKEQQKAAADAAVIESLTRVANSNIETLSFTKDPGQAYMAGTYPALANTPWFKEVHGANIAAGMKTAIPAINTLDMTMAAVKSGKLRVEDAADAMARYYRTVNTDSGITLQSMGLPAVQGYIVDIPGIGKVDFTDPTALIAALGKKIQRPKTFLEYIGEAAPATALVKF